MLCKTQFGENQGETELTLCHAELLALTWTGWSGLRTADEAVSPVTAHQRPHRADDLPLLLRVRRLLGDAQLVDDGVAGLDGDTGGVQGTAGDGV